MSASSDGTVKAWSPHSPTSTDPSTIGAHSDYARCLTHWYVCKLPWTTIAFNIFSQSRAELGCLRLLRPHYQTLGLTPHGHRSSSYDVPSGRASTQVIRVRCRRRSFWAHGSIWITGTRCTLMGPAHGQTNRSEYLLPPFIIY